jgi:hypothetical protein
MSRAFVDFFGRKRKKDEKANEKVRKAPLLAETNG